MSDEPWNLNKLRKYVEKNYSDPKIYLAQINSIGRTVDIFIYHMSTAKALIDRIEPKDHKDALNPIIPPKEKKFQLHDIRLGIQSETQATVHNARSIHDMFSQIANGLLISPPMEIAKCNIVGLAKKLPPSDLKDSIREMLDSESYSYINAFVNTIKHRNLVEFSARIDFQEGKGGVQFQGFEYGGRYFKPLWAVQVIENALEVKNRIVMAGRLLNGELGIT